MKKTKLVLTLALGGLLVSAGALNAAAATSESAETIGKVEFTEPGKDSEGEITRPDTDEEIIDIPGGGSSTKGPLRLTFVPHFDFGSVEVSSQTKYQNAIFPTYTKDGTEAGKIAHFIQVEDLRGGTIDDWNVTVKATKFSGKDAQGATHTLGSSVVTFKEAKVFNTNIANIADSVAAFPATGGNITTTEAAIPNDGTGSLTLINTKEGKGTPSSKTSLVFNNTYVAEKPVGDGDVAVGNPGVQIKSVGKDLKVKDVSYEATITWTLASTL